MNLFILAPVKGVPFSKRKAGNFGSRGFRFAHFLNAFIGHSGLLFSKISTIVAVAVLLSLGHFSLKCNTDWLLFKLEDMFSPSRVKSGSKVDSVFESNSCILKAPAKAMVATAQMRHLSCS